MNNNRKTNLIVALLAGCLLINCGTNNSEDNPDATINSDAEHGEGEHHERAEGGSGGGIAAPTAKPILQYLLDQPVTPVSLGAEAD